MAITDKLKAIADAIRSKTGKTETMRLDDMPSEIGAIKCGTIESLSVTQNGTYVVPDGVDGYSPVTVEVPIPDGYIVPSGILEVTENGVYDVTSYADVNVDVEGGGAEDVAGLLGDTLTTIDNSFATSLVSRACQGRTQLVTVNLPNVTSIDTYAFYGCSNLTSVKMQKATSVKTQCFYGCKKLSYADFGVVGSFQAQVFNGCSSLTTLILRKSDSICTMANTSTLSNSGVGKGSGYIYVPATLVEQYKTATNWSTFASQIRAIEDYPDITGG
jgi:hypothetical protein